MRLNKTALNAGTAILLSIYCACVYAPPPMLVLDHARSQINFAPPGWYDEPAVVLDDSVDLSIEKAGGGKNQVTELSVRYIYIQRRNPTIFEDIDEVESPGVETAPSITVTAYYPDGSTWRSSAADILKTPLLYENAYATDNVLHRLAVPRYTEGMVLRVEVRRIFTAPEFVSGEYVREKIPILKKRIMLSWPADYSIAYMVKNGERIAIDSLHWQSGNRAGIALSAGTLEKMQFENRLKYPEEWYAALHCSVPPEGRESYSWAQLGDHYLRRVAGVFATSAKINRWVESLDKKQPDSIIVQAFALQQQKVRYYANEAEAHAFIPRPARVVAEKGYGDCKEMAALFKTLCAQKGIGLGMALVITEGYVQCIEAAPTLGCFNHAIAYCARGDSAVSFFDPTVYFGTAADSYFHLIGQKALLLNPGTSRIAIIGQGRGYANTIETSSSISRRASDGRWEMRGSIVMRGKSAFMLYPIFTEKKAGETQRFLSQFLLEKFSVNAVAGDIAVTSSDRVEITFTADIQRNYLALEKGGMVLSAPSIFAGDVRYTTITNEGPRYLVCFEQRDTWRLAGDFAELEKSDLTNQFGTGAWKRTGKTVERTFVQNEAIVPGEKRKELNEYYMRLSKFMKATCWK